MRMKYEIIYEFNGGIEIREVECDDWRYVPDSEMHIFNRRKNVYEISEADDILFALSKDKFIQATLVEEEDASQ